MTTLIVCAKTRGPTTIPCFAVFAMFAVACSNNTASPGARTPDANATDANSTVGSGGAVAPGTGGQSAAGGISGTGGTTSRGGGPGTGGNGTAGGSKGTGGSAGTGGTTRPASTGGGGRAIILDTDMASDVDDAGALAILHALADNDEAKILGVICSNNGDTGTTSLPFIDIVNTYYGRPNLPIGLWKGNFDAGSKYTGPIAADSATYPHDLTADKNGVPEAAALYRKLLAAQPDNSVTIVVVGPMVALKDLLASQADTTSPLSGSDLVAKKVTQLVVMGGGYPKSSGPEWNFYIAQRGYAAVKTVVDTWPTPIVFDGLEIGLYMMTGASLKNTPANNPVRRAYELYTGNVGGTRSSFDLTAVLYAVRGAESNWDLVTTGHNEVSVPGEGSNEWLASPDKDQSYLKAKATNEDVAKEIDALLEKAPGTSTGAGGSTGTGGSTGAGGIAGTGGPMPPACGTSSSDPAPADSWVNATGNLAGMASECGNVSLVSAKPCSKTIITTVGGKGLYWTEDAGKTWSPLGMGAGSDRISHRLSSMVYDPTNPDTFWESGIYGSNGGVYKTTDGGKTFKQMGTIAHNDSISVDLKDPQRKTMLAGGHEQALKLWLSKDSGGTFSDIGAALGSGAAACTSTLVIDAKTFLVGCNGQGPVGIYRSADGGTTFTHIVDKAVNVQPLWAADGTIYWTIESGGIYTSTDLGQTFTMHGDGTIAAAVMAPTSLVELPDGRIVVLGKDHLQISSDKGATWKAIGKPLPLGGGGYGGLSGVTYSAQTKTFFIWHWDCTNAVPADAIWSAGFDYTKP